MALVDEFRDPAHLAVERALHKRDRDAYHQRWPRGHCPLCTPVQNALSACAAHEKLRDRVTALLEDL